MTALLVAIALAHRVPVSLIALAVGALWSPIVTGTMVLGIVATTAFGDSRRRRVDPTVGTIVGAAGDLRAGRPLRAVVASGAFGDELAAVARRGLPLRTSSHRELSMFGEDAILVAATLDLASDSGGPVAAAFDQLAVGMVEAERTRRERRAAMAPVIAQATVVGGVPAIALLQMIFTGRLIDLVLSGTISAAVSIAGSSAVLGGIVWIVAMVTGSGQKW